MPSLDVNLNDGKGWGTIRTSTSITTLKKFAAIYRAKALDHSVSKVVFRIFDENEAVVKVGQRKMGRMKWDDGNKKPRLENCLGDNIAPQKCRCGSEAEIDFDERNYLYIIQCESNSCPAKSTSDHSLAVINNWNAL